MSGNEVSVRVEHQRGVPAVNIRVWPPSDLAPLLPLELGQVKEADEAQPHTITTDPGFTAEWVEALPESTRETWWQQACEDGFELAKEIAMETFGPGVSVWQEGRSGGWLTVEGLGDPREWEREQIVAWQPFAEAVKQLVAGTTYRWLWLLNANVFEVGEDEEPEEQQMLTVDHAHVLLDALSALADTDIGQEAHGYDGRPMATADGYVELMGQARTILERMVEQG